MSTVEENVKLHEQDLKRLQGLCLMDDDFLNAFFKDNPEDTELMLRIIMGKPDLKVKRVDVQDTLKNLRGRSIRIDIRATDSEGKEYGIEIQRADQGAGIKRARYNNAVLDASILRPGQDTEELPEVFTIFITDHDVMGRDKPIYSIDRYIMMDDGEYVPARDGSHILYVNGAKKGDSTDLEKLMHDFSCTRADDMYYEQLAKTMRYYKEDGKGVSIMCKAMEDMRNDVRIENALKMINGGKLTLEEVAEYSGLSLEKVKELAGKMTA